jgi:hypothetical protein
VKAVRSCGGGPFLHWHCSRVARFDDIFYFGFWINSSLLFFKSSALCQLSKCNDIAFTLHLRGGVQV